MLELLETVCNKLTRKDVSSQVCGPRFKEEYGGVEWVQCVGLVDNRWVEVNLVQLLQLTALLLCRE